MSEIMFKFKENQEMWDFFYDNSIDVWNKENKDRLENTVWSDEEKYYYSYKTKNGICVKNITPYKYEFNKKRMSIQQHKPIILEFERFVNKSFNEITAEDIKDFSNITNKKTKLSHLNAFFICCVKSRVLKNSNKSFLISLLPEIYQGVAEVIAEINL